MTLARLAARNALSMMTNSPAATPAAQTGQRQISRMAMNKSTLVISIVADTAMP